MRDSVEPNQGPCVATADVSAGGTTSTADGRAVGAWCAWLGALATNAEAALAAALAYKQLGNEARDHWLTAVEQDMEYLNIPRIAAFAPLLAVEADPERRLRISNAIGPGSDDVTVSSDIKGLAGYDACGLRVCVVIAPLYLDFVQVLACGYHTNEGFEWVRHEPILCRSAAPTESQVLDGATLESVPMNLLIDELAYAIVAHRRSERSMPEALSFFAHLFDTQASCTTGLLDSR